MAVLESVEVLNGTIKAGDTVGVAVSANSGGAGMRIGEVLQITGQRAMNGCYKWQEIKVRVTASSRYGVNYGVPYVKTYEDPSRIVKL